MAHLARNTLLILGGIVGTMYTYDFVRVQYIGRRNRKILSMGTPAWAMVANSTINDSKEPKNTQAVIGILKKLATQTILTPEISNVFTAASIVVQEWQNKTLTFDVYRMRLSNTFPLTTNPSTQSLLSVSLPD